MAAAETTRISVIIPAFNEEGTLRRTLQRLQPMRARGHEVIVVDGGSADGTRAEATALADRVLEGARGRARQMHAGACAAQGDILWFLHADTLAPESAGRLILDALAAGRCDWGWFDVRLTGASRRLACVAWFMNRRARLTGISTGDQGLYVRRALYRQAGGFPPIVLMEDIALSRALRRLGRPVQIAVPLLSSARRWEKHGILRTILTMWGLRLGYFLGVDPQRLARFYAVHRA